MKNKKVDLITKEELLTLEDMASTIGNYSTLCAQLTLSDRLTKQTKKELWKTCLELTRISTRFSCMVIFSDLIEDKIKCQK